MVKLYQIINVLGDFFSLFEKKHFFCFDCPVVIVNCNFTPHSLFVPPYSGVHGTRSIEQWANSNYIHPAFEILKLITAHLNLFSDVSHNIWVEGCNLDSMILKLIIINAFAFTVETVILAFEHYIVMLGSIVMLSTLLVPQMGGDNVRFLPHFTSPCQMCAI